MQKKKNYKNANKKNSENKNTKVIVSFPDNISINLVQANELKHYELFLWLVTILTPIAAGFLIAYLTDGTKNNGLLFSTIAFAFISILFVLLAISYRKKIFHSSIKKETLLRDFK